MATYGFLEQFVEPVKDGRKTQTIRQMRKYPPKKGDLLKMKCKGVMFGSALITEVFELSFIFLNTEINGCCFETADHAIHGEELKAFAARDGLEVEELVKFLRRYSKNKAGWNRFLAIRWKDFQKIQEEKGVF